MSQHRFVNPAVLLLLPLVDMQFSVQAQDTSSTIGHVSIASPTAASLGKFGDIPVSYHTGIPQIGVPVYTVQAGSLKLPIGLSYHAGGLKVQEPAGWVGAGWSLNAGGVITRTVVGAPDDRGNNSGTYVTNGHYTDYGFNSYLNASGTSVPDDLAFARGYKDGEPDLFFFNFGGYTGKFYFNDDRTPIMVPEQDFKIQPYLQTSSGFVGFIVTTPDGARYYFGQTGNNGAVNPVESTIPSTTQNGVSSANAATSSWFLNKVISADGVDSITLNYASESYSYYTLSMYPVLNTNYYPNTGSYTQTGFNMVKNFVSGVRLTQISFPNGQVIFTPSASARTDLTAGSGTNNTFTDASNTSAYSLGSIKILDNQGFCKKDSLYYGYFYDASSLNSNLSSYSTYSIHSDQYRLRLDSLQETSCDGSVVIPPYRFSYFSEAVPRRLSFGIDHWGYANGANSNTTLVPTYTIATAGSTPVTHTSDNRDGAWPAMRGGALQQITYPTGGNTQFTFGPKATYSFSGSTLMNMPVSDLVCRMYGQGQLTDTTTFTVQNSGYAVSLTFNYTANYSATFTILNSSNTQVFYDGNVYSSYSTNVTLSAGTYKAILTLPNVGNLTGGVEAKLSQYQNVTLSTSQVVGGLRINSITNNDALTAIPVVTTYNYLDNVSNTNDILYSVPVYVQTLRNDLLKLVWPYCSPNGCSTCDGYGGHSYYISPGSIRPMASVQGENVGYNEVDVSQTGNGYSIYRYFGPSGNGSNFTDVCVRFLSQSGTCDVTIPSFPSPPVPFDPLRDELKYEGHFNQAGQLLKDINYSPVYTPDSLVTPGHISVDLPGMFTYTEYNLQSCRKTSNQVLETVYDPAGGTSLPTTHTTYYGSLFHNQPTRKVVTTSTGDSLVTNLKYAVDFRIASCDGVLDSLPYYMSTVHSDSTTMYSNIASCTPQSNDVSNCRSTVFTTFRESMMQARQQFIAWRRRNYAADTSNAVSRCYVTALSTADTLLKPVLRLQNMFQNPVIETSEWKDTKLRQASFIKYDTSLSPVGFAYPGRMQLVNLQGISTTFTSATVSGSTITRDSRYQDETVYKFSTGHPIQVTGRDGVPTSYLWDYQNKVPIAKITNATIDQAAFTSFEADGSGSWTIGGTSRDTTSAIAGKKSYNLSGGACTRSGLTSASTYVVSYWSKTGSSFTVSGSSSTVQGKTINGWTYFEHSVTGITTVSVSGTGNIDELRLYPASAKMITYTYQPLVGMTTQADVNNRVAYYQYDAAGRLKAIKDQDGNALKSYDYKYNTSIVYANVVKSGSFVRNNCTAGYAGDTVVYTVAAATYTSPISQAYVDSLAQNDVNTNGQSYANAHGNCNAVPATITCSNPSSITGYSVRFTNVSTSVQTTFSIPAAGGTLGTIPAATYNVYIWKTGAVGALVFTINCNSLNIFAVSATFSNVVITNTSCNGISLDYP